MTASPFYTTGGTLRPDAPSYVERQADRDLYDALVRREYCYVLNTRQMGKSSLMVRTASRLREAGVTVAVLDLTAIGQNLSPEQWYEGLLVSLGQQLGLEDELDDFWLDNERLGPLQRFMEALRQVVLTTGTRRHGGPEGENGGQEERGTEGADRLPTPTHPHLRTPTHPLVIFVDEIDAVRSLPFSVDEFFAGVRECYNRRTREPQFERLTFCLLGVATPADLIRETRMSPFNIGRRILLTDFSVEEARPLAQGLKGGEAVLARVLHWTGGQPYMTQRLCREAAETGAARAQEVDALCERLFLSRQAHESDDHLAFVRNRLLRSEADVAALLDLYTQVRSRRCVPDDETNPLCSILKLAGVARAVDSRLQPRNRIYDRVFDREWVQAHMPDAEVRRQKAAFRRGLARASAVAAVLVGIMGGLTGTAIGYAAKANQASRENQVTARRLQLALGRQEEAYRRLEAALADARRQRVRADSEAKHAGQEARRATHEAALAKASRKRAELARTQADEQRRQADLQREQANLQRARADLERGQALRQSALAQERLVRLNVTNGAGLLNEGDVGSSLLWFNEALRLDPERPREALHRMRIGTALERSPRIRRVWFLKNGAAAQPSPDGRRVWIGEPGVGHRVLDVRTGALLLSEPADDVRPVFAPDGRHYYFTRTGRVEGWDLETGRQTEMPFRQAGPIVDLAFSRDGSRAATRGQDGTIRVWDPTSGKQLGAPLPHQGPAKVIGLSANGGRLLTQSPEGMHVWDTASGRRLSAPFAPSYSPAHAAISPDGRRVAIAPSNFPVVLLWDADTGACVGQPVRFVEPVLGIAFSPDSRRMAAFDRYLARVQDARTADPVSPALRHRHYVWSAQFSPDSRRLLTSSSDGTAVVWDVASGERAFPPLRHANHVVAASFTPDGRQVFTTSEDQALRLWDLPSNEPWEREVADVNAFQGAASPAARRVLAASNQDHLVRVWDLASGRPAGPSLRHPPDASLYGASFSPDGKRVVSFNGLPGTSGAANPQGSAAAVGEARIWDVADGRLAVGPLKHPAPVLSAQFSPDERLLVTGCGVRGGGSQGAASPGEARVWDARTGAAVTPPLSHGAAVRCVTFSPDGRRLATASEDGTARVWDARTGRPLSPPMRHASWVVDVAFSPDGRRLVTAVLDYGLHSREARVWDAATGRPVTPPLTHSDGVYSAVFSHDGRRVATGGEDGTARIWDARTGKPLIPALQHQSWVTRVEFSPDDRLLLTTSHDNTARVWDARTGEAVTPPLDQAGLSFAALDAAGKRAITVGTTVRFWPLAPDSRPLPQLLSLAQLTSGRRIDETSGAVPLTLSQLQAAWSGAGAVASPGRSELPESLLNWHRRETQAAEAAREVLPALFHLEQSLKLQPDDPTLQSWRDRLLPRAGPASSSFREALRRRLTARDPAATPAQLDLSACYNLALADDLHDIAGNNLASLRPGLQSLGGVLFDARGVVQLTNVLFRLQGLPYPEAAPAIPVGRAFRRLHALHATAFVVPDGTPIGSLVFHYVDGRTMSVPVVYGRDVRDWFSASDGRTGGVTTVWSGPSEFASRYGSPVRLFKSTWENPLPGVAVSRLEYRSAITQCAPFLIALTTE